MEPLEQQIPPSPAPPLALPPSFKDRRPWLIVFGVFELLIALAFVGMGLMMVMIPQEALKKAQEAQQPGAPQISMLGLAAMYAAFGTVWIVVGIGTILAKNWARIVSIILCYFWLVCGVLGILISALILPTTLRHQASNADRGSETFVLLFVLGFMIFLMVIIPAIFLLFFHNKNVKATCTRGEGAVESTRPVLMNVLIALFALSLLGAPFSLFSRYPAVLFGTPIWGLSGKLVILISLIAEAVALWGFIKSDIRGWWVAIFSSLFWTLSTSALFFRHGNLIDLYEKMGVNVQPMRSMPGAFAVGGFFMILFVLARIIAVFYSRRYFPAASALPGGTVA